jgi:diguanylate cyclase (GGDEF)-like protein
MSDRSQRRSSQAAIWGLVVVVLGVAAAAYRLHVESLHALATPHLPWWSLALGFAAGEAAVVDLHFRRSAHSFPFVAVPLVLGLIFANAPTLLAGALLGSSAAWIVDRRRPPIKIAFNVAQLALAICVAETIVHALSGVVHTITPTLWLVVFLAVQAAALTTVALISAAITLSDGPPARGMLREMFGFDLVLTVITTALALLAAVIIRTQAQAAPLLLVLAAMLYLASRAFLNERRRSERLAFLYDATKTLSEAPDVTAALGEVLDRSREAFRVELAELVLFSSGDKVPLQISSVPTRPNETMVPIDTGIAEDLRAVAGRDGSAVILEPPCESIRLDVYLRRRGITSAVVALLPGDERVAGVLMLANRVGLVDGFDADDLKLLGALATNTGAAFRSDRLEHAVWQLHELHAQLEREASQDRVTGLANRAVFVTRVKDALAHETDAAAVLVIDIDDFKAVNDRFGQMIGDDVLVAIADRLRACVLPGDVIARLGGDEFGVLLRDVADPTAAGTAVAQRVIRALEAPLPVAGARLAIRASVGVAAARAGYEGPDEVMRNADLAMDRAKHAGKGQQVVFEPWMRSAAIERHNLRGDLERAIERAQLTVEYQPIVSLSDRRLVAVEALVRWKRQYGTVLSASEFVPIAREDGLIVAVGEFVLGAACRQARDSLGTGPLGGDVRVHVNLSDVELEDAGLVGRVAQVLEQSGLPPSLLVFEITEGAALRDAERSSSQLAALREHGVGLALDGFGMGSSSLAYLCHLPFGLVKLARPITDGLTRSKRDVALVRTVKELCDTKELDVVAVGVETDEQLELLRSLGIGLGQGFLLGRPGAGASISTGAYAPG